MALVLGVGVLALRRADLKTYGPRFLAQFGSPLLVLAPWSLSLLPFGFFQEAGLPFGASAASALDLLGVSPGGPGTGGGLLLIGLVLAALAALLRAERRTAILTAWTAALVGLVFAALSNGSAWAGPATLVYGIALLASRHAGRGRRPLARRRAELRLAPAGRRADRPGLRRRPARPRRGLDGPRRRRSRRAARPGAGAGCSSPRRAPPATRPAPWSSTPTPPTASPTSWCAAPGPAWATRRSPPRTARTNCSTRSSPTSSPASGADQADQLGGFAVRYVLVHQGAPREVTRVLDATPGLELTSQQAGGALWRVDRQVARAAVVPAEGEGEPEPVAAGPVEIHTDIEDGAEGRVLRLADSAAEGWTATLDGKALTPTTVDGWAQGFELPASGGRLDVTYDEPFTHTLWMWAQGLLAVVLVVMALPGRSRDIDDDLPEEEPVPAEAMAA